MYLYITAVQNEDCEAGAAAWARPCLFDLGNNRPQLGAANVCPGALRLLDEETLTAVLTHEMIHALVGGGAPSDHRKATARAAERRNCSAAYFLKKRPD